VALGAFSFWLDIRVPARLVFLEAAMGSPKRFLVVSMLLVVSIAANSQPVDNRQQIAFHAQQAKQFLRAHQPDQAIGEFRAIVALDPKNVDALGNLGVLLYFEGDYTHAIPELEAALKLDPVLWKIQALLGMAQRRMGELESAIPNLEKSFSNLVEKDIQIDVGMELVEMYSGQERLEKAARVIDLLRNKYPTDLRVLYTSYRIHSDLAGESMLSLSLVAPHSAQMRQVMAHELARQGQMDAAIRNYREALKIDPTLSGLHFELAEALNASDARENKQEAKKEYEAALSVNKFDEKAECRLGTIAYQAGDLKSSFSHYSRAVQLQPDDPEASVGLAKDLMERNETQKAQALLEHAVHLDPTSPEAHFRLATIYRKEGRVADAKHELEQYQNLRSMKEKLRTLYKEMRIQPTQQESEQGMGSR
jgi:Tfp pilus assembly protein PilF